MEQSFTNLDLVWSFRIAKVKSLKLYLKKRNDMSTTFLQQIIGDKLLLVVIVGAKK